MGGGGGGGGGGGVIGLGGGEALVSPFAQGLIPIAKVLFLETRFGAFIPIVEVLFLETRFGAFLYLHPNLRFS